MDYDVVVLGGGPGGSTVSTLLSDYGKKVLLIEKSNFPRYHIGESLLSGTADLMKKVGVLEQVERDGYIKKWGVEWLWGRERKSWTVYFRDALAMPHDYGYQVERDAFDDMLLKNAIAHGVTVLQPCLALDAIQDGGGRVCGVRYRKEGSETIEEASARFVVDATGQGGHITRKLNKIEWDKKLRNMAIWGYWEGAERSSGLDAGNTFLPTFEEGWWWFIPLRNDRTSVGAVIDRNNFDKVKQVGYEKFYLQAIEKTGALARRLRNAKRVDEIRVQRDWSYRYDKFYGNGFIAVGDAACFIDPLFSTGVHLAMLAGYLASVTVNTMLDKGAQYSEDSLLDFYQRQYEAEYYRLRAQVYFLYGGHGADKESYFWNARRQFDVPGIDPKKAFISLIAGAFEHRSWYSRYLCQLDVPEHLRVLFEGRFTGHYTDDDVIHHDRPIVVGDSWRLIDDYAIDGNYLRSSKVIRFDDGASLPYDEIYRAIIDAADGDRMFAEMVDHVVAELDMPAERVRSSLEKALTYGAVQCLGIERKPEATLESLTSAAKEI